MEEKFLHFVWQHQYFSRQELKTHDNLPVTVVHPGYRNSDAGPDFLNAKLKIGEIEWHGHVEIHVKSSDWYAHNHSADESYKNTVLHVVWNNDKVILRSDRSEIGTLELEGRIEPSIYDRFKKLVRSPLAIPCESQLGRVSSIVKTSLLEKVVVERLITKSKTILDLMKNNQGDWEETAYQVLGRNFGFKTNADTFFELTRSIPYRILLKHSKNIHQIEALLFGQAGFLGEPVKDDYSVRLLSEFNFLKHKYQLEPRVALHQWKFLRMRPANFPSIRLSQFAALLNTRSGLFSWILNCSDLKELIKGFQVVQSNYWKSHYRLDVNSTSGIAGMGKSSASNIIINSVVTILAAYSQAIDDDSVMERAVNLLQNLKAENNRVTRIYSDLGWKPANASDSQGLLELNRNYCLKKRCTQCSIGAKIMRGIQ